MERPGSTQDKPDAKDLVAGKCRVEFDNVSFSYVADSPVLKGVSFQCPGGQTLALVGATGALPCGQGFLGMSFMPVLLRNYRLHGISLVSSCP